MIFIDSICKIALITFNKLNLIKKK